MGRRICDEETKQERDSVSVVTLHPFFLTGVKSEENSEMHL